MADEVDKKQLNDTGAHPKPPVASGSIAGAIANDNGMPRYRPERRRLFMGLGILAILVLALLGIAGFATLNNLQQRLATQGTESGYVGGGMRMYSYGGTGFGRGQSIQTNVNNGTVTTTVYNYMTGVVVAVNSDNIVIAGNGKQTTIKTNSSTTYVGDVKPVVNDTVTIAGTTTDSVITATEINVTNG